MDKYRMLSKKGEGTFSEVLKCQNVKDGTFWACKKMKQQYTSSEELKEIREIQALRHLSNYPHVLQLHEVIFERKTGTLNLLFELMDMNLYELIKSQRSYFTNEKIANFMLQLLKAIEHMHKHGYFHRDIKPENILVKGDLLKLADFGSVRRINTKHPYTEYISTRWYRAPECLLTDGFYSFPMDIWGAGCVMFEIITLHPLFPGANEIDQIDKIHDILGTPDQSLLEKFKQKSRNMRFNFRAKKGIGISRYMPNIHKDAVELVNILCTYDPDDRITAHKALKHNFFNLIKEISNNKENEMITMFNEVELDRSSKKSIDTGFESGSVLELQPQLNRNGSTTELYKPVLKRKKYKNFNQFGSNISLNNNKNFNSSSLSQLGSHADLRITNSQQMIQNQNQSRNEVNYNHINFPTKKNFLQQQNNGYGLPKLNNSSGNTVSYSHQASGGNSFLLKANHPNGLPNIYLNPTRHGSFAEPKIIDGSKLNHKYS